MISDSPRVQNTQSDFTMDQRLKDIEDWFHNASDPPKQLWKDALYKLQGFKVKTGYIRDQPHFCYLMLELLSPDVETDSAGIGHVIRFEK